MRHYQNHSLAEYTSIKIGGTAADFFLPETAAELAEILSARRDCVILGGGSNQVLGDFFRRAVICLRGLAREPQIVTPPAGREIPEKTFVRVDAGYSLPRLVAWSMARGLAGLEILSGIPGTVGGALTMNAGTPRGSFGDVVRGAGIVPPGGEITEIPAEQLHFAYRHSELQAGGVFAGAVAVSVTIVLSGGRNPETLRAAAREITAGRASGRIRFPNCGSVFRNPPGGVSAGRLLEEAGMKGESAGALRVSFVHANFFENTGGAVFGDFRELLRRARERVRETSGVELEPEVKMLSD